MLNWLKVHPWLATFVGAYTLVFGLFAWKQGNNEFLFYTAAMLVYIAGVLALDRRLRLSTPTLWALAVWGLLHMAGGTVPIPETLKDGENAVLHAMRVVEWLPRYD